MSVNAEYVPYLRNFQCDKLSQKPHPLLNEEATEWVTRKGYGRRVDPFRILGGPFVSQRSKAF